MQGRVLEGLSVSLSKVSRAAADESVHIAIFKRWVKHNLSWVRNQPAAHPLLSFENKSLLKPKQHF